MIKGDIKAAFLQELTELTHKYGVAIAGCGCCGSPFLVEVKEEQADFSYSVFHREDELGLRSAEDIEQQEWWLKDE